MQVEHNSLTPRVEETTLVFSIQLLESKALSKAIGFEYQAAHPYSSDWAAWAAALR